MAGEKRTGSRSQVSVDIDLRSGVEARSSRPQSLILSIFGAFARSYDNWIPAFALTESMAELGVEEVATRNAISRLKRRHVLVAQTRHEFRGYAFSNSALEACISNDKSIYCRRDPADSTGWILVPFSVPESWRQKRYQLRSQSSKIGFTQVGAGLLIGPSHVKSEFTRLIKNLEMEQYVSIFEATYESNNASPETVGTWWDLDALSNEYIHFIDSYQSMKTKYAKKFPPVNAETFSDYMKLLTAWRFTAISDPVLPKSLLPKDWSGQKASDLFYALHDKLEPRATQYLDDLLPNVLRKKKSA